MIFQKIMIAMPGIIAETFVELCLVGHFANNVFKQGHIISIDFWRAPEEIAGP
jgi:hypothetical protein